MFAIAPTLAEPDKGIARPRIGEDRPPTVDEFLRVGGQSIKPKIRRKFQDSLTVCAAATCESLDKMPTILSSPLRDILAEWVKFTVGSGANFEHKESIFHFEFKFFLPSPPLRSSEASITVYLHITFPSDLEYPLANISLSGILDTP